MPRRKPSPLDRLFDMVEDGLDRFVDNMSVAAERIATGNTSPTTPPGPRPRQARRRNDPTHYDVLGVSRSAPLEVISAAYKALAAKHHPDKGGKPEIMQRINRAYEVLKDPDKRRAYDRTLA